MRIIITTDIVGLLIIVLGLLLLLLLCAWAGYHLGRREVRHWQATVANLPLGVALFDAAGQPTFSNAQANALIPQIDPSQIEQAVQSGRRGVQQTSVTSGANGNAVQLQCWPLSGGPGHVLLTLRDISQQQQAAANYRKFIYSVSHELLTPLTAMQGHLSHIEASGGGDERSWRGSLRVVQDEVERLTRLTSNLLLLSRLESGQPLQRHPINLTAVAEEAMLQLLDKADARHMALNIHATPQLAHPPLDRDAWKQVFVNLIDNAIKYGRDGGKVEISLNQQEGQLLVTVADDGPGISAEDLPHIFTEMYRAEGERQVSGSGLGLTIVRRIVEQHGGRITCQSEPGKGTTFIITLPLVADELQFGNVSVTLCVSSWVMR